MKERSYQILLAILTLAGALVGAFVTSYLDHNPPVKSIPLQTIFVKSENVSYVTDPRDYPIIVDRSGISVRDFAGLSVFFYFTAIRTGRVGMNDDGTIFYDSNLTAYARLFLDLQPVTNTTLARFNNQGRFTGLPAQHNTDYYSVSISMPLVRVNTIEVQAFLSCWRCNATLADVTVNGTLFYE